MARRWLTSDGYNVIEHTVAKIAVNGVVKRITKGVVSHEGVNRQFWPPAAGTNDPRNLWTDAPITVSQLVDDPTDSFARITFTRSSGLYSYDQHPDADGQALYLNPPLDGTVADDGIYEIRVDQTGGDALTGTLGAWIDLNSAASFDWSLDQTVVGSGTATANISIRGNSVTVVKPVTFLSEVRATTTVTWTALQRDLETITQGADALCVLRFNPDGTATGIADTGSFSENWHRDAPNVTDPENYTVNTTVTSGDDPIGNELAADLTLDSVREWTLIAGTEQDLSNNLSVVVSDGVVSATKVVTMHSQRITAPTESVWTADSWVLTDVWDTGVGPAGVSISVDTDGYVRATKNNAPGGETEAWHSEAPTPSDPENYEARLDLVTGDSGLVSGSLSVWTNLEFGTGWSVSATTGEINVLTFNLSIRRIGDNTTTKPIRITLSVER